MINKEKIVNIRKTVEICFDCKEITNYMEEIRNISSGLIQKAIRENSPAQKGDIVEVNEKLFKVRYVELLVSGSYYVGSDSKFSFYYWGIPLKKDGATEMKNRNPVSFGRFRKDGIEYGNPSYCRRVMMPARIDRGCGYYKSWDTDKRPFSWMR